MATARCSSAFARHRAAAAGSRRYCARMSAFRAACNSGRRRLRGTRLIVSSARRKSANITISTNKNGARRRRF